MKRFQRLFYVLILTFYTGETAVFYPVIEIMHSVTTQQLTSTPTTPPSPKSNSILIKSLCKAILVPFGYCCGALFTSLFIRHLLIASKADINKTTAWKLYMYCFKHQKTIILALENCTKLAITYNLFCVGKQFIHQNAPLKT